MNGMCDETCKGCVYVRVMAGEIGFGNRRTRQTAWCDFIGVNGYPQGRCRDDGAAQDLPHRNWQAQGRQLDRPCRVRGDWSGGRGGDAKWTMSR